MKYFILEEDRNSLKRIKFRDFDGCSHHTFLKDQAMELNDISVLYVFDDEDASYKDFIENPIFMISDRLKKIFEVYEYRAEYKPTVFTNLEKKIQRLYHAALMERIDCISENTTYHKNGIENKIVLIGERIKDRNAFLIGGKAKDYFVVSLDLAESMIKRGITGFNIKEIEVI